MVSKIDIFAELGERLRRFGEDEQSQRVLAKAIAENEWFTAEDIHRAIDAICEEFLDREKLTAWIARYAISAEVRSVAIIMAGNIPLVGFFDMMCAVICGCETYVKPSSKDTVLTKYVIDTLRDISDDVHIFDYDSNAEYDMIIATGGAEAARYFRTRYASTPALIRGSRHSVAVLAGDESEQELRGLQDDIFTYNGLGCRNVSLIFLPSGKQLELRAPKMNPMYRGNYLHCKAMRSMMGQSFVDFGECIAVEERDFSSNISQINYCYYDDLVEVDNWLAEHDEELQCIVSRALSHPRAVAFGRAQYPTLCDYADGVDVMKFLTE